MDVDEFGDRSSQQLAPGSERAERDVVERRNVELLELPDQRVLAAADGRIVVVLHEKLMIEHLKPHPSPWIFLRFDTGCRVLLCLPYSRVD